MEEKSDNFCHCGAEATALVTLACWPHGRRQWMSVIHTSCNLGAHILCS